VFSQPFLQLCKVLHTFSVNTDNDIVHFQVTSRRTSINHLSYQHTIGSTQFLHFLLDFFRHHLLVIINRSTLDTQYRTLNGSVFFQIGYYLFHNTGRDGKTVSGISSCRWIKHRVDTYQLSFCIDQCPTTVTLVNSCIRLDEWLHTLIIYAQRTCLGTHNTGGYCRCHIKRITYSQYPLAHFQSLRIAYGNSGKFIRFNFNQR